MALATSQELRQKGNDFYKQCDFMKAIELYSQAALSAPLDPAPVGNLSAAYLESGQYAAAIQTCDQALNLHGNAPGNTAARAKLLARKCRSCVYQKRFDEAAQILEQLTDGHEKNNVQHILSTETLNRAQVPDAKSLHARLINEVPRYRAQLNETPEYYSVGHDTPASLIDLELLRDKKKCSILFGGIGDARNLLQTLATTSHLCKKDSLRDSRFHFTINDLKPVVLARDIVVLNARLFYDFLQYVITNLIKALKDETNLPPFLDVPEQYREAIIEVLKEWTDPFYATMPSREVRRMAREARSANPRWASVRETIAKACHKQMDFYRHTSLLLLDEKYFAFHNEPLRKAYERFDGRHPELLRDDTLDELVTSWANNPTMFDHGFRTRKHPTHAGIFGGNIPFDWAFHDEDLEDCSLFKQFTLFVYTVCDGMEQLRGRYRIEVCIGDITRFMERIRYDQDVERIGSRPADRMTANQGEANVTAQDPLNCYPRLYDRIHLSNVPDYIGGSLSTFLYAVPILEQGSTSFVTAENLRNPPRFRKESDFHREYTCLGSYAALEDVFQVTKGKTVHGSLAEDEMYMAVAYIRWAKSPAKSERLMKRADLETWLFRLFLKLALPVEREFRHFQMIYSPLNLSIFLKLCVHLYALGYPAHWIASVLEDICSGKISTTARPPRSDPLSAKELARRMPARQQSLMPFVQEMCVLLALWQPVIPFGIVSQHIPAIQDIHLYTHEFKNINPPEPKGQFNEPPVFNLMIYNQELMDEYGHPPSRAALCDDEEADHGPAAVKMREEGVHILATWIRSGNKASFCFDRQKWHEMLAAGVWKLRVYRTDMWCSWNKAVPLHRVTDLGPWIDWKNPDA